MAFFRKGINAARRCVRGAVRRAVRFGGEGVPAVGEINVWQTEINVWQTEINVWFG